MAFFLVSWRCGARRLTHENSGCVRRIALLRCCAAEGAVCMGFALIECSAASQEKRGLYG